MAEPLILSGQLFLMPHSPQIKMPAYMVFSRKSDSTVLGQVLEDLRSQALREQNKPLKND
jgi:hypothetical protein